MWKDKVRGKASTIKPINRLSKLFIIKDAPAENRQRACHEPEDNTPAVPAGKWQLALIGLCAIASIMIIVWFAHGGISDLTNTPAISSERNNSQKSLDWRKQQVIDADIYYERRARETEEGFNSAFPFHS